MFPWWMLSKRCRDGPCQSWLTEFLELHVGRVAGRGRSVDVGAALGAERVGERLSEFMVFGSQSLHLLVGDLEPP